jgi:hypothetical protein
MSTSIYLVNPASDFPSYYGGEVFAASGFEPGTLVADLPLPTLAALAPRDFEVRIGDESVGPIDFETGADFVGITGKVNQQARMRAIAAEFRRRGKVVLIGGPFASLCPEAMRAHADILVQGEVEEIAASLFADLRERRWKDTYVGGRPDLRDSPVPRWDLYPNERALLATVQTSRGCPFECEFCDVIQYLGRKQRAKGVAQVLAELDEVHRAGYRSVFLADDNFTVYRSRAKELLAAIAAWNGRHAGAPLSFVTQVSIDAARDDELLALCGAAGFSHVFIGIETPNEASLRETKKLQNVGIDLVEQIERFLRHGVGVIAGMIVGFDADGPDIFERQYRFAMASPVPIFSLYALVAPARTPLRARLAGAGRLASEEYHTGMPWDTNVVPRLLTREQQIAGQRWLSNALYAPEAFGQRVLRAIELMGEGAAGAARTEKLRPIEREGLEIVLGLAELGPDEAEMVSRIRRASAKKPATRGFAFSMLQMYAQARHMFAAGRFWEPRLNAPAA